MARIRTIKPEAFVSESLAEVSLSAERTFFGLLTQADDEGRHRDHPAILAGLLWPLRPEHTPVHVEDDLQQLQRAGLVCRYTGCDGRRYLHIVTWDRHQKINRPTASRLPACAEHHPQRRCPPCGSAPCAAAQCHADGTHGGFSERSMSPHTVPDGASGVPACIGEPSASPRSDPPAARPAPADPPRGSEEAAAQYRSGSGSVQAHGGLTEPSRPGSRILDPGSQDPSGRAAPAPDASAQQLVGEYAAACAGRPPGKVLGHLGREIRMLLDEGIDPVHIRAGLERFRAKPMHPSVLASLVNEAMNAPAPDARAVHPAGGGYRGWTNPADAAAAYAEEL